MTIQTTAELNGCNRLGQDISIYYNTGTCETPVWVLHEGVVGDLTINETDDENEQPVRDPNQLIKVYNPGKTDVNPTGEITFDPLYEGAFLFNSMRNGGAPADLLILSGDIEEEGNIGWRGAWWNFDRTWNAPETGNATQNFSLRPAACQNCMVRTVYVATGGDVEDYDPGIFVPAS